MFGCIRSFPDCSNCSVGKRIQKWFSSRNQSWSSISAELDHSIDLIDSTQQLCLLSLRANSFTLRGLGTWTQTKTIHGLGFLTPDVFALNSPTQPTAKVTRRYPSRVYSESPTDTRKAMDARSQFHCLNGFSPWPWQVSKSINQSNLQESWWHWCLVAVLHGSYHLLKAQAA